MTVPTFSINAPIPREAGAGPNWRPPVWGLGWLSQMDQCQAQNNAAYAKAFAAAGAHSQPPTNPWERDT